MNIRRWLPFLGWPKPSRGSLWADARAGFSVGLVLVPQAVAYAALAGMPPQTGLYAAMIPSIIGVLWGSSPLLAAGPVALTSLLTFGSLQGLATPGSVLWVTLAIWLAIYSGVIQLALGCFRLGAIGNFISFPALKGFINAAALIIIASQLPALLGFGHWNLGNLHQWQAGLFDGDGILPLLVGLGSITFLFLARRFFPRQPAVLYVCILGIALSYLTGYQELGGAVVGELPHGLPSLVLPDSISFEQHRSLLPAALIIALVSFTEAMSSARTLSRKREERWDENQELIGQGLAKLASGSFGAFPISGSFSRSALNLYVGATSGWSSVFAALCVALCLLFFTHPLAYLPTSVLAAVIIVPVINLLDWRVFTRVGKSCPEDGVTAAVTFIATLVSVPQLHWGVLTGFLLAMLISVYRRSRPRIIEAGVHEDGVFRDRARYHMPVLAEDVLVVRMDSALIYTTAPALEAFILDHISPATKDVVVLCSGINDIDATGIECLGELSELLRKRGICLRLAGVKMQVWRRLERSSSFASLNADKAFLSDDEVKKFYRKERVKGAQVPDPGPAPEWHI
ncbi:SulP family inorganic anion transporter [Pokkaliibacter sp. CJK22405]|uniref:SulP family inorganic anion transporter n=1 Tax=Pokkaliibacter sp. CJK22405 TaxID=3384615 RepID=UPI00398504EC